MSCPIFFFEREARKSGSHPCFRFGIKRWGAGEHSGLAGDSAWHQKNARDSQYIAAARGATTQQHNASRSSNANAAGELPQRTQTFLDTTLLPPIASHECGFCLPTEKRVWALLGAHEKQAVGCTCSPLKRK